MKRVLIFGVFDFLHPGHIAFIKEAKSYGDELIAVIARDMSVVELKGRKPHDTEIERMRAVQGVSEVDKVVLGDSVQGTYSAIEKFYPQILCFGYDQENLFNDVESRIKKGICKKMTLIRCSAHKPKEYKSSLARSEIEK